MKDEKKIEKAIDDIRNFINTEVARGLLTDEGKGYFLDRIKTLKWVLEED